MTAVTHEDVRRLAGHLAQKITMSLWPHADALPRTYLRYNEGAMPSSCWMPW
ncbi:hypothetical protein [Streptomyces sp. NPDC101455]|uniref:hypothetical protein n=1 Tax=Streptomyces sp. NPDC101455 TaxID=3366142 RepID=UPI0038104231